MQIAANHDENKNSFEEKNYTGAGETCTKTCEFFSMREAEIFNVDMLNLVEMIYFFFGICVWQIETGKKTLILRSTKTSNVLNAVLAEIYHLKRNSAIKYSKKNENIRPFESGGETSLEFFSLKTDCGVFVVSLQLCCFTSL